MLGIYVSLFSMHLYICLFISFIYTRDIVGHQKMFSSQTSEIRTNVHGQSSNRVGHKGSNSSLHVDTVDHSISPRACKPWKCTNQGGQGRSVFPRVQGFIP